MNQPSCSLIQPSKKASKYEFIESPVLPRKRKRPNYKTIEHHFQIEGYHYNAEAHHPSTPGEQYRYIYISKPLTS